ncbi:hypothetical protein T265_05695 [Opisthorchis viverrini]|uniref:FCP1 homology domain-containing protein n=1 Tax=Opisthorchis viverrini TaxID=6198 RepID=A0A074ZV39_OPIVI|nr:hypothetical protein T265_05695 [Opisthorchis viverrini]KER27230.1 hypothetical protein T265_05695 [Opisthorchis viverrini]
MSATVYLISPLKYRPPWTILTRPDHSPDLASRLTRMPLDPIEVNWDWSNSQLPVTYEHQPIIRQSSFSVSGTIIRVRNTNVFKLRHSVYLVALNVRGSKQEIMLLLFSHWTCSALMCAVSQKQEASAVAELTSPLFSTRFRKRASGYAAAAAAGCAGVGIILSHRAEVSLLDWIPVDSHLCAVCLATSVKKCHKREVDRCPFILSAYAPTYDSSDDIEDRFYNSVSLRLLWPMFLTYPDVSPDGSPVGEYYDFTRFINFSGAGWLKLLEREFSDQKFRGSNSTSTSRLPCLGLGNLTDCEESELFSADDQHVAVYGSSNVVFPRKNGLEKVGPKNRTLQTVEMTTGALFSTAEILLELGPQPKPLAQKPNRKAAVFGGKCKCIIISTEQVAIHVPTPNLEVQETVFVRPLTIDQPGMRDSITQYQSVKYDIVPLSPLSKYRLSFQHTGFLYLNGYFALSDLMFNLHIKVIFIGFIIHFTGTLRRKVMVLDLDETLIHSVHDGTLRPTVRPGTPPDFVLKVDIDHHPVRFSVHKRPHVDFFLNVISQWYELVIYTASLEIYGAGVTEHLDNGRRILQRRFYRQHCTYDNGSYSKNLSLITSDLASIFILDNSPGAYRSYPVGHLASLILRHVTVARESLTREHQAEFRPGGDCVDHVFTLRQMLEQCRMYKRPTFLVILGPKGAFDFVGRSVLLTIFAPHGIPQKFVNMIRSLYSQVHGELSKNFLTKSGVRQGFPLSPFLFKFAVDG